MHKNAFAAKALPQTLPREPVALYSRSPSWIWKKTKKANNVKRKDIKKEKI